MTNQTLGPKKKLARLPNITAVLNVSSLYSYNGCSVLTSHFSSDKLITLNNRKSSE